MENWGEIGQSLEATSKSNLIFIVCLWRFLALTHFMRRVSFDTPLWCFQGVSKDTSDMEMCFNCVSMCFKCVSMRIFVFIAEFQIVLSWTNQSPGGVLERMSLKNSQNSQKSIIDVVVDFSQNIWQLLHEIFKITLFQKKKKRKKERKKLYLFSEESSLFPSSLKKTHGHFKLAERLSFPPNLIVIMQEQPSNMYSRILSGSALF